MLNTPLAILLATVIVLLPVKVSSGAGLRLTIPSQQKIYQLPPKDQRGLKLMQDLIAGGFTPVIAAGFAGNVSQESDFKPHIASSSGVGFVQWCGYRKRGLRRFAEIHGACWSDPSLQAKWIVHELTAGTETEYLPPILKAKTPKDVALQVSRHYERPRLRGANNSFRMNEAERFYKLWADHLFAKKF